MTYAMLGRQKKVKGPNIPSLSKACLSHLGLLLIIFCCPCSLWFGFVFNPP